MLTLRQMRLLDALVETGTVSAAAKRENVTQPAVSKALAAMEAQVGFAVFERRNRRLILTAKGQSLLIEVQQLLGRMDAFSGVVEDIRTRGAQRIRLATTVAIASSRFLSAALAEFTRRNPQVHLEIETMTRPEIVRTAVGERADVVVSFLPFTNSEVETTRIGTSKILAVAKKNTWLKSGDVLTPSSLSALPLIFLFERSRLRRTLDQFMYRSGFSMEVRAEASNSLVAVGLAAAGGGVAICDDISLDSFDQSQFDICGFSEDLSLDIGVLHRRGKQRSDYQTEIESLILQYKHN